MPPAPDVGDPPEPTLPAPPVVLDPLVTLLAVDPVVTADPPCPPPLVVVALLAVVPPSVRSLRSRESSPPQPTAAKRPPKTHFPSFIVCLARSEDFSRRLP
jgi:hypothetical protein